MDRDYVCGDYGDVKEWIRIRVTVKTEQLDKLTPIMSMVSNTLQIEDYSDIEEDNLYGTLIDESILNADKTHASVSVYLPGNRSVTEEVDFLKAHLESSGIEYEMQLSGVNEEDWANSWKQYYKPIKVGSRIVIVPAWESYAPQPGEIPVVMDPGMAFGTGSHETTRLIIRMLEDYVKPGCSVLDVGTGSGILSICAAKLGAGSCKAYDLDPVAVRVAGENVKDAGLEGTVSVGRSDLLAGAEKPDRPYDLICANIVADILIRMSGQLEPFAGKDTLILCSGIIDSRKDDVIGAMNKAGYSVFRTETENDWVAIVFRKTAAST